MRRTSLLLCVLALLVATASSRSLQQGTKPAECLEWRQDEIQCRIPCPSTGDIEFDCETENVGTKVECEVDPPGAGNSVDFDCPITNGKATCDFGALQGRLPECAREPVQRILEAWQPRS